MLTPDLGGTVATNYNSHLRNEETEAKVLNSGGTGN